MKITNTSIFCHYVSVWPSIQTISSVSTKSLLISPLLNPWKLWWFKDSHKVLAIPLIQRQSLFLTLGIWGWHCMVASLQDGPHFLFLHALSQSPSLGIKASLCEKTVWWKGQSLTSGVSAHRALRLLHGPLGSLTLGEGSHPVMRTFKQPGGEAHVQKSMSLLAIWEMGAPAPIRPQMSTALADILTASHEISQDRSTQQSCSIIPD